MQHREHEPEVDRDRRVPGEQRLDPFLDPEVVLVDVVVEGDHVVGELFVVLRERVQCAAQHAQDEGAFFLQACFELVELLLKTDSHEVRPTRNGPSRNPRCACRPAR